MTDNNNFIFNDVDTVVNYLFSLKPDISPVKLHKGLYFLFAYHGALYKKQSEDGVFEGSQQSSKYLFNAEIAAWKYGPVIREVFLKNESDNYGKQEEMNKAVLEISKNVEIKKFIDELFAQIDSVSDFSLIERSHQDQSWKQAYNTEEKIMNKNEIIKEYVEKYL